jgi:uncharacterized protein (DUF983 family)
MKRSPMLKRRRRPVRREVCPVTGDHPSLAFRPGVGICRRPNGAKANMTVMKKQLPLTGVSPYLTGMSCRCPRCGKGKLFEGFLTLKPDCDSCGLDFSFADAGDGPAIFVIMIAGAIVVGAALITEVKYQPPYWIHAVLWVPLILIVTLWPLRGLKSLLISLQFHHKASQAKLTPRVDK